jgi:glutamine synthetase
MNTDNGKTLCIPTVFISWTGEALDKKTPLLRSNAAMDKAGNRVLTLLGETKITPLNSSCGAEQEYFLVDSNFVVNRPDLMLAGRTLFGKMPAKGQEFDDHYFGAIPERVQVFMQDVEEQLYKLSIPAKTRHNEVAPGQFEINLKHEPNPISACDNGVLLKRLVKGVAKKMGMTATFMAKPYGQQAGSGMHIHCSLMDGEKNVFSDPKDSIGSSVLYHAVGGLAEIMKESMAIFCPNPNSYRRFQPDLYVPMAPTWGIDNRTVALRIPTSPEIAKRIEHRVSGADANPYLVMASLLAGIHHGITNKIDPPKISTGDAIAKHSPSLPMTWVESLNAFSKSKILKEYFGKEFCHVYYETKNKEMQKFDSNVTPLELDWYLRTV